MRWDSIRDLNCSVARTLSVVGERWTMLILRDAFLGHRRFDEFQRGTGIARNILSSRLRELVASGVLERTKGEGDGARVEYRLTRKGADLYPVLVAMLKWGDNWLADENGPPLTLIHRPCGAKTAPRVVCSECGGNLAARDVIAVPRRPAQPARKHTRTAHRAQSR
jgi:DNA-binding HxlR family transcriptional regulator